MLIQKCQQRALIPVPRVPVDTIAMRRSQRLCDSASLNSGLRDLCSRNLPTTCGAEQSTKSQLLILCV